MFCWTLFAFFYFPPRKIAKKTSFGEKGGYFDTFKNACIGLKIQSKKIQKYVFDVKFSAEHDAGVIFPK